MSVSKIQIAVVAVVAIVAVAGVVVVLNMDKNDNNTYSEGAITITTPIDYKGNTVEQTFSKVPEKVVIGCNTALDIFLYFGLGDKIVGIYYMEEEVPQSLKAEYNKVVNRIGNDHVLTGNISQAVLTSWEPDCVIGWVAFTDGKLGSASYWNNLKCNVWALRTMVDMDDMAGMKLDYSNIGNIFNIKAKTDKYITDLEKKIEKVKPLLANKSTKYAIVDGIPKTTEYWFYKDQFINNLLNGWGATNVFPEGKTQKAVLYDRISQIDVLFEVCYGEVKYDNVLNHWKSDSVLKTAPAIVKNQVYALNLSIAYGADPTVMDVIDRLVEILK